MKLCKERMNPNASSEANTVLNNLQEHSHTEQKNVTILSFQITFSQLLIHFLLNMKNGEDARNVCEAEKNYFVIFCG